jgi:membrane protease subunit (stomatin/prohibitin family)
MGLFDRVKGQLRSVIQWENPSPDVLFSRWTDNGDEIKNASRLIVGPGQGCIFVYEGKVQGVYTNEGMVDLKTANIPFWTTITKFMQAFVSEHKVGIYFFKTTDILNQKWGTSSTIKYEDPKYKFPVGLRAFGNYSFRLTEPRSFFVNVLGAKAIYTLDDFRAVMGARIIQPLTDFLAESHFTYTEIDANREELAKGISAKLTAEFGALGFAISDFRIEGTSFDEDTMRRINRIADMSAEAQAATAAGINFVQMQQLQAMRDAAKNEGGGAGLGMGMGAGVGFGQMMAGMMQGAQQQPLSAPSAPSAEDPVAKLAKLKQMADAGLITVAEFEAKKKDILSKM